MNKTTLIDIKNRVCENRVFSARLRGHVLHIICPFCSEPSEALFHNVAENNVHCACGALLTGWYIAYQKKGVTNNDGYYE